MKKTLAEGSKKLRVSHGMENLGRATKLAYRSGKVYLRALCTQKMCVWVIRCLVKGIFTKEHTHTQIQHELSHMTAE